MAEKDTKFDVAVIGAGPAGLIAAGTAAHLGLSVALIEKNPAPGKKLLLTGNGRCNLTNAEFNLRKLVKSYNNGEFLFNIFAVFGPKETIKFFEDIGIKTKIEEGKRVFPVSNDANEILEALNKYLVKNKVNTIFNSEITDIAHKGKKITGLTAKNPSGQTKEIKAKKYILCTGGKSFPLTGSNGFGYEMAEKLGHTIATPMPALAPIELKEEWIKNIQGISLEDVGISVFQKNKKHISEIGELIFTHFGISGPTILDISSGLGDLLQKGETKIFLDFFPYLNQEELSKKLEEVFKRGVKKAVKNMLALSLPERLAETLLGISKIDLNKISNNISKIEKAVLIKTLKNFELTAKNVYGFEVAKFTKGGISLKEIDHKTMKSKIIDNLFFAGEIIDVDGKSGGFNLQMCWSTGYIAGKSCK